MKNLSTELTRTLSADRPPFAEIYDAISEQLLLLMFKARQLGQDPDWHGWFAEQHRLLAILCAKKDQIAEIFKSDHHGIGEKEKPADDVLYALAFMRRLYDGFDNNQVSMKTWGQINKQPESWQGHFSRSLMAESAFINNELIDILLKAKASSEPIPVEIRQGYCHQDLSIAYSCADVLIAKLNAWFDIDPLALLAEAVFQLVYTYRNQPLVLPGWLSRFEGLQIYNPLPTISDNYAFKEIYKVLKQHREEFIRGVQNDADDREAEHLLELYRKAAAKQVCDWLWNIMDYLKAPQWTPFRWKFLTVVPPTDAAQSESQANQQWNDDYCQIAILRENLLELIQKNSLEDATKFLAGCLERIYGKAAADKSQGLPTPVSDEEKKGYASNHYLFTPPRESSRERDADSLAVFEKWYMQNKVLLMRHNGKRTEKVSVEAWLAGLKCFDLKRGIPNGDAMKIKDGVYNKIKEDKHLKMPKGSSHISLQRYHNRVKEGIAHIEAFIAQQQASNQLAPYSGARDAIKPLWGKSLIHSSSSQSEAPEEDRPVRNLDE
ncbi:hypothetical protein [Atlantibacter sp.]|uniref:hypothetical protein n=1 Tax=Atlantibacter sp. TaxID=1903473 RepID=UPI0028A9F611|nr:hypothetical protein [Atlantibacter sp.]